MKKILVTGSGGIGGVNFVRALRATDEEFFLVGTDFNQYYLEFLPCIYEYGHELLIQHLCVL